jgi:fermentation-respiration switch protein FrsA (DUF1100 family)
VLVVHGTHDTIVPVRHGRALGDMGNHVKYIEFDCGHNDFPGIGRDAEYWGEIREFLSAQGILRDDRP